MSAAARLEDRPTGQVTKLTSGDDLDDDFMAEDSNVTLTPVADNIKENDVKPKKKKGPKVVNFVG